MFFKGLGCQQQNDGFLGFVIDEEYQVRFANRPTPDGGFDMLRPSNGGGWEPFLSIAGEDALTTFVVGFDRPENSLSFSAISEAFLANVLGGRYEPIGSDFEGASFTVLTGAGEIPGLSEALAEVN